MTIYSGSTKLFDVALGATDVKEVYVGATKVFPEPLPTVTVAAAATDFPAAGGTVSLTATATGAAPLEYLWQEFLPGGEWLTYETTTVNTSSRAITVSGVQYRCIVRDAYYPTNAQAVSAAVTCTLHAVPTNSTTVDVNPIVEGQTANFTCTAAGFGTLTYQWYYHVGDSVWVAIAGATAATYARVMSFAENGWTFTCNATDSLGQLGSSSSPITMTVSKPAVSLNTSWRATGSDTVKTYTPTGLAAGNIFVNIMNQRNAGSGPPAITAGGTILGTFSSGSRVIQVCAYTSGAITAQFGDGQDSQWILYAFNNSTTFTALHNTSSADGPALACAANSWTVNGLCWNGTQNIAAVNSTPWGNEHPDFVTWPNCVGMARATPAAVTEDPGTWTTGGSSPNVGATINITN